MKQNISIRTGIIILFIFFAALSRLLPHPPNFTPVGGMALFGAAYFSRKYLVFLIPLLAMWISDLLLNNLVYAEYQTGFAWFSVYSIPVYVSFILIGILGFVLLKKVRLTNLLVASVLASVLFFLLTNFGSWLANPIYSKDLGGLTAAYAAGLPFFWNTLAGDLFYAALMFGSFEWINRKVLQTQLSS